MIINTSINSIISFRGKTLAAKPVKIAVIDTFNPQYPSVDINGDRCPDITHGETVCHILRGNLKVNAKLIPLEVASYKTGKEKITKQKILDQFTEIEKRDDIPYANMSIGVHLDFQKALEKTKNGLGPRLRKKLGINDDLSIDDITTQKSAVKNLVLANMIIDNENKGKRIFNKFLKKAENLGKTKKIFISAGNEGEEHFNAYALANNVICVGNMNSDFLKEPSSCDNRLVSVFAKGTYKSRIIHENGRSIGFDITEDGVVDVPIERITGYETIKKFEGQDEKTVKATEEDYTKLKYHFMHKKEVKNKLFSENKLIEKGLLKKEPTKTDTYLDFESYLTFKKRCYKKQPSFIFIFKNGKAVYKPFKKVLKGTSFSSPTALAQVVNEDASRKAEFAACC